MIQVLDDKTINKIAAGEVVERPASALKELIENAIDANSDEIKVELQEGGKRLILVRDNGTGMDRRNAELCLQRHATSKIRSDRDLFKVMTLGFRGEAIPSIASVSRFEIRTRMKDSSVGTCIKIDGGNLNETSDVGCPVGTQISVRNLFFNVPPRKKFLRADSTELSHCQEAIIRQALIRPWLDIELVHNGITSIRAPKVNSISERAESLLGSAGVGLIPVDFKIGQIAVTGLVSPVGVHRATGSNNSYVYVNGRYVKDTAIRRAVRDAYTGLIPKGRFPVVVLLIDVPPQDVDVNVHPAKIEVRFQQIKELSNGMSREIRAVLQTHGLKHLKPKTVSSTPALPEHFQPSLSYSRQPVPDFGPNSVQTTSKSYGPSKIIRSVENNDNTVQEPMESPFPRPVQSILNNEIEYGDIARLVRLPTDANNLSINGWPRYDGTQDMVLDDILPVDSYSDLRVIGQVNLTYILCEGRGELVVIDQHAAHERITLYRLASNPQLEIGSSQILLTPITITFTPQRLSALEPNLDVLSKYGIEAETFGGNNLIIRQLPEFLNQTDITPLLQDVADDIANGGGGAPIHQFLQERLAIRACHNSIRAGDKLSLFQMDNLLSELDEVDFGVCAHGRPVAIIIKPSELEKRFHRN